MSPDERVALREANRAAYQAEKAALRESMAVDVPEVTTAHPYFSQWTPAEREAVWQGVLNAIRDGASYTAACKAYGLHKSSYWRDWVSKGREGDLEEARVAQAEVHLARAEQRVNRLFRLQGENLTMPEVARTKVGLEHDRWMAGVTAPKRYGPKVQIEKRVTKLVVELRDESGAGFRIGQGEA